MIKSDDSTHIWELIEKIGFCMLTTQIGNDMRARPMAVHVEPIENTIYFLTDVASHKDDEIVRRPDVCLAFADTRSRKYVSISGTAQVLNDRERIRELWTTPARAWWETPDDPSIRVLKVTPSFAEYWESPGTIISYIKMAAAAMSDKEPDMGHNAKVNF
ncbi:pyridoxamine 5'-phosphate oxidase family protein [Agrobacterium rhizogenes]|nr:pyridoxamine 5'-phosphate oxidase family protein [Rhizobium rhizogenes]NTH62121.1 pyridoxamine 5'-phosphate oxidase family protein [Rhizobium rhizogenes]NTH93747.1 pyridoxamine 5'-phosphate oxidase family protein [Rhizobium rhizogenes]